MHAVLVYSATLLNAPWIQTAAAMQATQMALAADLLQCDVVGAFTAGALESASCDRFGDQDAPAETARLRFWSTALLRERHSSYHRRVWNRVMSCSHKLRGCRRARGAPAPGRDAGAGRLAAVRRPVRRSRRLATQPRGQVSVHDAASSLVHADT